MNPPPRDAAVTSVAERLDAWFEALSQELEETRRGFARGGDSAAVDFVGVLQDALREHRDAFTKFRTNVAASSTDRLRWMQQLGGELTALVGELERLDGAIAPRLSPLVAAFERLLQGLIPGRAVVIRPFRHLNYELGIVFSERFDGLGIDLTASHRFPALFLKIPTGFLDSPRNHILIAHELGHALAAEKREQVQQNARAAAKARRLGQPPPSPVTPLYSVPQAPRHRLEEIARIYWSERSLPPPTIPAPGAPAGADQLLYVKALTDVTSAVQTITGLWLEELFADTVGVCLLGPAFAFAFLEVLLPLDQLEQASYDHPPTATRILSIRELLEHPELAGMFATLPSGLQARLDATVSEASAALARVPGPCDTAAEAQAYVLAHELVMSAASAIRDVAVSLARLLLYKPQQFARDLETYLEDFVKLGVPPLGSPPDRRVSLATIFNVGQVVALERLSEFYGAETTVRRWQRLDDLLLKAIELAEVQHVWEVTV